MVLLYLLCLLAVGFFLAYFFGNARRFVQPASARFLLAASCFVLTEEEERTTNKQQQR
jgi:hypothetical protein